LRKAEWRRYFEWAVECFRLCSTGVADETQVHTHMCYSEFNYVIDAIGAMDADVISIETSRSKVELLDAFKTYKYPNEIGPGVYDIRSPRVPEVGEMTDLLKLAQQRLADAQLWNNPDCGLKTRDWKRFDSRSSIWSRRRGGFVHRRIDGDGAMSAARPDDADIHLPPFGVHPRPRMSVNRLPIVGWIPRRRFGRDCARRHKVTQRRCERRLGPGITGRVNSRLVHRGRRQRRQISLAASEASRHE
jgi:hypothetical protein